MEYFIRKLIIFWGGETELTVSIPKWKYRCEPRPTLLDNILTFLISKVPLEGPAGRFPSQNLITLIINSLRIRLQFSFPFFA